MHISKEKTKEIIIAGITLSGAFLVRKIIEKSKFKLTKRKAPKNLVHQDITWQEATIWAVSTGAVIGLTKLLLRRNVTIGLEKWLNNR